MKDKFTPVYTVFISLVYLAGISIFGYTLFSEYTHYLHNPTYSMQISLILGSIQKSFFVILGATLLTVILIIASKDEENIEIIENIDSSETNNISVEQEITEIENKDTEIKNSDKEVTKTIENSELYYTQPDFTNKKEENKTPEGKESIYYKNEYQLNEETQKSINAELPSEEQKPIQISPEGLFSPVTGFGWENYLITRLDSELNRAISSEFDLSLFLLNIPNLPRESEITKQICEYLTVQFQFKDLLFEYKNDSFVAIKTNMMIEEALIFADKIYADINKILSSTEYKLYIGITSRTIRIISGERLLKESIEALKHAHEDESNPIIAFRANAEKYMKMIQKTN